MLIGAGLIAAVTGMAVAMAQLAIRNTAVWRKNHPAETEAADLAHFGYGQQLLRDMGGFSNFALSFSVISVLTGGITLYGSGIKTAGPAIMGLGWPLVTLFVLFVAASMAELASAIPTAGALYHWSAILGGPTWGWFTAFLNLVGLIATITGIDFGCAQFLVPLLHIPDSPVTELLVCGGIILVQALLNHRGIRLVGRLNDISAVYHIFGVLAIVIALALFAPKQPLDTLFAKTFTTVTDHPYGYAFLIGLLQAQWTYTGYDASAHVSEETRDPRLRAPWGVYWAVVISAIAGYAMLAMVTLAIRDLPAQANADNPFISIMEGALGSFAGRVCTWLAVIAMLFCGLACITSTSRMIFAFARDGGLPGSGRLRQVDSHGSPGAAVWLAAGLAFLLPLVILVIFWLNPKSSSRPNGLVFADLYSAVVGISTIGLYLSYGAPILLRLAAIRSGRWDAIGHGPWSLGRVSSAIAFVALAWIAFISVLFVLPPNTLTGWIFGGVFLAGTAWFFAAARGRFTGPPREGQGGSGR
jgi:amino acid transporter